MRTARRQFLFFCLIIFLTFLFFFVIPKSDILATNVLTNPSFTGGSTGWTLSSATYDAATYQDSAGSVTAFAARKASTTATITQNSYVANVSTNLVYLSGWHQINIGGNGDSTLYIEREAQSTPGTWVQIWTSGLINIAYSWTQINALDVSSSFGTGSYRIRIRMQLNGGASAGAGINAYFDNLNLDVIVPTITVSTTGTQVTESHPSEADVYIGGAFRFIRNTGSTTVTSITVSETGSITDANISGLILYYKQEATCSTSIPGDATVFNGTPGTFNSGSSTVTGSMTVGTSQICVYAEVDIGAGAQVDETVEIQITNPSTQVTASVGAVAPATAIAIAGTTTITLGGILDVGIVDGSDQPVTSPSVQFAASPFSWADTQSTGTLGTSTQKIKISNYSVVHTWTLSIAATDGVSALWESTPYSYDYNGSQSTGRLYVNPIAATITPGGACSSTGLTKQSASYFVSGSIDTINLVVASGSAQTDCDWYITGIALTQDIPARQHSGTYSIGMTITVI